MSQTSRLLNARMLRPLLAALIFSAALMLSRSAVFAVPMAPNESWAIAEVLDVAVIDSQTLDIQPPQKLFRSSLRIISTEAVPGVENILQGFAGKTIEALSREPLGGADVKGKTVKVRVTFQGDERRGRYWILESAAVTRTR